MKTFLSTKCFGDKSTSGNCHSILVQQDSKIVNVFHGSDGTHIVYYSQDYDIKGNMISTTMTPSLATN